ncbi:MAG TPA: DUF167 domain-containing protein [Nocardioides sp.]|nr:DUF167 domain-containing protein [Nocardioides sp.]
MRVSIRVRPGASRTQVGGAYGDALVVKVAVPAEAGRATEAALQALADALGVRRREVSLVSGSTHRTKVVEIPDTAADAYRALRASRNHYLGG